MTGNIVTTLDDLVCRYMADHYQEKPRAILLGALEMRAFQEYSARHMGTVQERTRCWPPAFDGIPIVQSSEPSVAVAIASPG